MTRYVRRAHADRRCRLNPFRRFESCENLIHRLSAKGSRRSHRDKGVFTRIASSYFVYLRLRSPYTFVTFPHSHVSILSLKTIYHLCGSCLWTIPYIILVFSGLQLSSRTSMLSFCICMTICLICIFSTDLRFVLFRRTAL